MTIPSSEDTVLPEGHQEAGWRLKSLHMEEDQPAVPITVDGLTLGRSASNDIVLDSEEFPGVSGTHARVVLCENGVRLEDLDSKNGTFVGGYPVDRVPLSHGDVFELGRGGARFVLISPSRNDHTVLTAEVERPQRSMGAETVEMMREKLGILANTDVTAVVQKESRRNTYLLLVVIAFLITAGVYLYYEQDARQLAMEELNQRLTENRAQFDSHRETWETRVTRLDRARESWDEQKKTLLAEKKRLVQVLRDRPKTADLDKFREQIREQIKQTDLRIEKYNPINLEQKRLAKVSLVQRAVVLIEVEKTYVHPDTKKVLFVERGLGGGRDPNLEGRGEVYVEASTGSGFCFHKDGWILTNAHVVLKKDSDDEISFGPDTDLKAKVDIRVVFSGTDVRHRATVVKWVATGNKDLALLKIESFKGIPFLPGIDTRPATVPPGTKVYLLGFPLGKQVLQQGRTMIASANSGIVSRTVKSYLQTDAAVLPGNSGGPVTDSNGKVVGVVVGMQRLDEHRSTSSIGYVIPIAHAKEIWPPPGVKLGK